MSTHSPIPAPQFDANDLGPRCLVTGGAGYLGSALVRRLHESGCRVRSFDVREHQHPAGVETVAGDLCSATDMAAACKDIDTVFHTVALINLSRLYHRAEYDLVYRVNVGGMRNVLNAARAAKVKAVVHTSTGNVVLDGVLEDCDESLPYVHDAKDLYSRSKIEAEKLALAADTADGMRVCALRPGGLWGNEVNSVMIRHFLDQLKAGRLKATIGDGRSTMDNTHIENLLDAQLLAAQGLRRNPEQVGGQAFFIFDGEKINPMQWFQPLTEGLGYTFPSRRIPGKLMLNIAWLLEVMHYLGGPQATLSVRAIRNLLESSSLSIAKAQRVLGYQPRYNRDSGLDTLLPAARAYIAAPA